MISQGQQSEASRDDLRINNCVGVGNHRYFLGRLGGYKHSMFEEGALNLYVAVARILQVLVKSLGPVV